MNAAAFALIVAAVLLGVYAAAVCWRTFKAGGWHGNRCLVCRQGTLRPHRARFAWRWPGFPGHGHLCFICRSFTAGGRPGAELLAIALPHHWHASTASWLPA